MASSASIQQNRLTVEAKIKSLINNDLKEICRGENLAVSGVKAQLQGRIIAHLESIVVRGDVQAFERMRYRVNNHGISDVAVSPSTNYGSSISPGPNPGNGNGNGNGTMAALYGRPPLPNFSGRPSAYSAPRGLAFKSSPFYVDPRPLTQPQELIEMQTNRHTVNVPLVLSQADCDNLKTNPNMRVMIYCAAALGIGAFAAPAQSDIAFPNQLEVKVNGEDVRSNFKGLKNKPGTTKPADITSLVRKAADYKNQLHVTYALTTKKYTVVINMVKKVSPEDLAEKVKNGRRISKDQVLREMQARANDPDIVAEKTVMSLKDPISTMRMTLPCRSTFCTHNQCFDGSYFLQLQEQAPTWTCPVCNKSLSYDSLCIDQYVQDILQQTSSSTEQITIEPDGKWHPVVQGDNGSANRGQGQVRASYDNDSDDDILEIPDTRVDKIKAEAASSATPGIAQQTPPLSSREPSMAAPLPVRPGKRPSAVIDLTLSDDDEPPRPAKRPYSTSQSTSYNTPTSLPGNRLADMGHRPSSFVGPGPGPFNGRPDTLPPLQPGQVNGGLQNGQRLPWPTGPAQSTSFFGSFREHHSNGSYSNSPG